MSGHDSDTVDIFRLRKQVFHEIYCTYLLSLLWRSPSCLDAVKLMNNELLVVSRAYSASES